MCGPAAPRSRPSFSTPAPLPQGVHICADQQRQSLDDDASRGTAEKVRFLSSPEAYDDRPSVTVLETHMSWLFLTGTRVYKFKKPVRYPFLDFSTLSRRKRYCSAELTLNRRLAGRVYRRLAALRRGPSGRLSLDGQGEVVEWLVEMEQLPDGDMLDNRLRRGAVTTDEIVAVADVLGRFYADARPQRHDGWKYIKHLEVETAVNRTIMTRPGCALPLERSLNLLGRVEGLLTASTPLILERIAMGCIVEGHGDLRPEHVCLRPPPQIIDCLEFDRSMRLLDPYDEINYLGLECEMLGASWIRPLVLDVVDGYLGKRPEPRLMAFYGAFRAMLRARICIAHLLDPHPMQPARWPLEAMRYLDVAERECVRAEG